MGELKDCALMEMNQKREGDTLKEREEFAFFSDIHEKGWDLMLKKKYLV